MDEDFQFVISGEYTPVENLKEYVDRDLKSLKLAQIVEKLL